MKLIPMEGQPIYKVRSSSSYTNVHVLTRKLEDVLKKQQRFGLLLVKEVSWGDKNAMRESRDVLMSWLRENKTAMSMYCLGLAVVTSNQKEQQLAYRTKASPSTTVSYGCPKAVFDQEEDALEWLQVQINYYCNKWALTNF
ncbi:hypothetical protein BRE01_08680 [Brevibacillus reuszeri]|uniref:STAS/SEC14 domain-containing protein n=1 Tax=Brevibacillus reuszeri TaxID=54915 RepID=A0A0K9YS64_9BACL|nr:hypothetical protein [Brevibacillus reuszeri]KNB71511.1 hypothetical protein ADS79_22330 [Brevibacillus reuszeri]MED1855685.1 hypothetical protein [Brevibacillus reuszeri]GED67166.1 hypothetical protein BRE01_08680 [Brevibacillus reuszeri]